MSPHFKQVKTRLWKCFVSGLHFYNMHIYQAFPNTKCMPSSLYPRNMSTCSSSWIDRATNQRFSFFLPSSYSKTSLHNFFFSTLIYIITITNISLNLLVKFRIISFKFLIYNIIYNNQQNSKIHKITYKVETGKSWVQGQLGSHETLSKENNPKQSTYVTYIQYRLKKKQKKKNSTDTISYLFRLSRF